MTTRIDAINEALRSLAEIAKAGEVEDDYARPRGRAVTDEQLRYVNELRESGRSNMYGAPAHVAREFGTSAEVALDIVRYWGALREQEARRRFPDVG